MITRATEMLYLIFFDNFLSAIFSQLKKKFPYIFVFSSVTRLNVSQPAFTFSKFTIETLEQGVKYVQS